MKLVLSALVALLASAVATVSIAQPSSNPPAAKPEPKSVGHPTELSLKRAGSTSIDLRKLPKTKQEKYERDELEPPDFAPIELSGSVPQPAGPVVPGPSAPAPAPLKSFLGLDFTAWGTGYPPDTNGDVGPTYFIETVNTAVGIYDKTTGNRVAAFSFNTLMSQGNFGTTCDTNNAGDPVVVYDTFEDRWIISDFAFTGIGAFQCFAVSKSGDPVTGGWNFYSLAITDGFGDYPKFGVWPDGLYMSVNMYTASSGGTYRNPRLFALNKAQMYTGAPSVQIAAFNAPSQEFTLLPANARLQTGTPPAGAPNYFSDVIQFMNGVSIYKFHVDWNRIANSTLTGPFVSTAPTSWAAPPGTVPTPGGNSTDTLLIRTMAQNQYTTFGGIESVWFSHSVLGAAAGTVAPRYYQVHVTGGTVAAATTQAATHAPDTTVNRYMPSLAVDRAGNMALGYSASSGTLNPAIRYAGRLSADPANTLPQTETSLIEGTASQYGTTRWGDYSSMSLDPDGCTFWMSNEYYATAGSDWQTRIGAFKLSNAGCAAVNSGSVHGTVTSLTTTAPIAGATVSLGSGRTATTNASGAYAVNAIAAGVYPSITATAPGYTAGVTTSLLVNDGVTTTKNFFLNEPPAGGCTTDTSLADFQLSATTNIDLATSPGDAVLASTSSVEQQNTTADDNSGTAFHGNTFAQTFTPGLSGPLPKVDLGLNCVNCSMTPDIKVSIRATAGSPAFPTGPDLASVTIPGLTPASQGLVSAVFANPPSLLAGTIYAIVMMPAADAGFSLTLRTSTQDAYPGTDNQLVLSTNSGSTWAVSPSGLPFDGVFKTYINQASGDLVSSLKDANPGIGYVSTWSTLSWTATTPANTSVRFQAAGSNSQYGPFNFVGPDGTANSYYATSGGALSQFNGQRYLRYRASLATTSGPATPTLNDATVCYANRPPPDLSISNTDGAAFAVAGGSVVYTITAGNANPSARTATGVTVADAFPGALTCSWTCSGSGGGTCLASGTGDIADSSVTLPPSSSVTYIATCSISGAAAGSLSTTATVTQLGEANLANNSATDVDTLRTSARCYVKADSTGTNAGTSWPNAYTDLQSALHDSSCNEIWVARGVYKPTPYVDVSSRSVSFLMRRGVGVYGGFAGGETLLAQRDLSSNPTVLSGDIDNNDTGSGGVDADWSKIVGNNSYHIVVIDGTTAAGAVTTSTVLDGFTISGGKADDALSSGGGVFCNGSPGACSPLLNNLSFSGNLAVFGGGALYNSGSGGISSPTISNSTFSGNSAANGGAIYDDGSEGGTSNPSIANATFSGNSASSCGGAIYDDASDFGTSSPVIQSATFSGNSADSANGDGSAICDFTATGLNATALTNAIVWSNTSPELSTYSGGMTLNHVVLQENACPNNAICSTTPIGADPHLGPLLDNGGFTHTMMPGVGSSAIDTGLDSACIAAPVNAEDQRGIGRPLGAHCDIGAVEATQLALSVNDATLFGLYGKTLQYVVTLQNSSATNAISGVRVSSEASSGLDTPNTLWQCTSGTCTTTLTQGPLVDVATVQPNASVTWLVNVPVLQSTASSATMTVHSSAVGSASDTDTLVIFRGSFDPP